MTFVINNRHSQLMSIVCITILRVAKTRTYMIFMQNFFQETTV